MTTVVDLLSLKGHVSVVTGGATGIGLQMATGLAEAGSNIVLCSRKVEVCEASCAELEKLGVKTLAVACDVTKPEQVEALKDTVLTKFGRVDVLMNNAGRAWVAPPEEMPLDRWQQVMDLNINAAMICSHTLDHAMCDDGTFCNGTELCVPEQGGCHIVLLRMAGQVDKKQIFPLTRASGARFQTAHGNIVTLQRHQHVVHSTRAVMHRHHQAGAILARGRRCGHGLRQANHGKAGAVVGFVLDGVSHRVQAKLGGSPFAEIGRAHV